MRKQIVTASKKNFWNDLRVKNNYSYKELADALSTNVGTVGNWFSGRVVPRQKALKDICDLFGVDYDIGRSEFQKAHDIWVPEFGKHMKGKTYKQKKASKPTFGPVEDFEEVDEEVDFKQPHPVVATVKGTISKEDLSEGPQTTVSEPNVQIPPFLRIIYGKVSVEEYEHYRAVGLAGNDPLEALYKKISFEEFVELYRLING